MEYVVCIVFGIIIVVLLILMYQMSLYNKINDSKIRIEESSSRIDIDLKDKLDLFNQVITITKEEEDLKNSFKELNKIKGRITNSYSLDKTLNESYKELEKILENNSKISKNSEIKTLSKKISIIDKELKALKKYHNINAEAYNNMLKKTSYKLIVKNKRLKEKELYN